jgi:prepilin-type N-terminal cleavage/methylation domain-containing protein
MIKNKKTQKGFTLIELLMVVAIIAILSTMILMMLDSGRERAEVNRYVAYATQMYRLVASTVAAGQFDHKRAGLGDDASFCLGDTRYDCGGAEALKEDDDAYKALTYLTEMPETNTDNAFSPYNKSQGVFATYKPNGDNLVRVYMYVISGDKDYVKKICDSMNWATDSTGAYCYADVNLNSRFNKIDSAADPGSD